MDLTQPILDLICAHTGMKATLLVGGPEPADGGRLNIIRYVEFFSPLVLASYHPSSSVHSGVTQGAIKSMFGELERAAYKDVVVPLYSRFLKKCYSEFKPSFPLTSHANALHFS